MDNQIDAARSARRSGTLYCSATIKRTNCTGATSDNTTHEPSVILFDSCEKKVHTYSITRFAGGVRGPNLSTAVTERAWGTATVLFLLLQEVALKKP